MSTLTERTGVDELAELAAHFRVRSIEMAERAGSGHPTSSMSAADLVAVLVARHFMVDPADPNEVGNDRLLFSKGHASPLLYAALESMGFLDDQVDGFEDVVDAYRQPGSILEGHPTPLVPGVPAATGSLGLGLAIGVGLAFGARLNGGPEAHVWVLCGDGELAEGAVWEAVEHAGSTPVRGLTAIIDVNRLGQTGETRHGWDLAAYRRRFEAFGWQTIEIDGHSLPDIDSALATARGAAVPTAVIAQTVKGRGAVETEDREGKHGKPLDEPATAIAGLGGQREMRIQTRRPTSTIASTPESERGFRLPTWDVGDDVATRDAFGATLAALGRGRPRMVVLDGDVKDSTRSARFEDDHPDRFIEAYIAEQLMAGMAIGLDASGWQPVMSTFGAFVTRAHDVLRMASIGRTSALIAGTHAGVSIGEDGPSQMALEDIAMMRSLAGSTVVSPSDANQTAALMAALCDVAGVRYLRLMRGATPVIHPPDANISIGGSAVLGDLHAPDVMLVATGVAVHEALEASRRLGDEQIAAPVLDVYSIKPIDDAAVAEGAACGRMVVVEDHRPEGGLGEAVMASLARTASSPRLSHLAVRHLPGSAPPEVQRQRAGIDCGSIVAAARDIVEEQ